MPGPCTFRSLLDAVDRWCDLMFDCDVSRFDQVFAQSAQLHGLRDGNLRLLRGKAAFEKLDQRRPETTDQSARSKSIASASYVLRMLFSYRSTNAFPPGGKAPGLP